jgi:hypothetical protein
MSRIGEGIGSDTQNLKSCIIQSTTETVCHTQTGVQTAQGPSRGS